MTDRPLPEDHENLLRTALKLEAGTQLPESLVELYWDAERTARRIGARIGSQEILLICLLANRPTPAEPASFLSEHAKYGDRVLAKFRKEWRWGTFKRFYGKNVVVQIDDDTAEDRGFAATSVRYPAKEELCLIGE